MSHALVFWASGPAPERRTAAGAYVPGVCNIGPAEIARRRRSGWIGAAITVVAWAAMAALDLPAVFRLLLFFPAAMSGAGFLQAAMHFCAYFGFSALFNVDKEAGKVDTVVEAESRARDRRTAWQIVSYSILNRGRIDGGVGRVPAVTVTTARATTARARGV